MTDKTVVRLTDSEKKELIHEIRTKLSQFQLTFTWLIRRLADEGLSTDKFEMSATMAGTRCGAKADKIIMLSVEILRDLEERMCVGVLK